MDVLPLLPVAWWCSSVFASFEGCVSEHRAASCENSWMARAAAAFGVSRSTFPLEAQFLLQHFGLPQPCISW